MGGLVTRPLYLQVRDAMAERVAKGNWKPGTILPNEIDLAREWGVSAGTMRKALDMLESERLITRRKGRGTFVNNLASQEEAIRFSNLHLPDGQRVGGLIELRKITLAPGSEVECRSLELQPAELVYRIDRTRSHNNKIFMVERVAMPPALFPDLPAKDVSPFCAVVIGQAYGILLGDAVENISMADASVAAAEALNIAVGSPVVVFDRVIRAREGRPAEWRRAECLLKTLHYVVKTT